MNNQMPKGWKETSINDFLKEDSLYSDGDWVESKDQDDEGFNRLIQLADIGDGVFLNKSNKFMNDEQFKRLRCTALKEGDILIARMPDPLGRACFFPMLNQRCATVVDVAILRNPNADAYWLVSMINSSQFRRKIEIHSTGTTRTRITRGFLAQLKFLAPDLVSQQKIAAILITIDQTIEKTEALIHKYQQIKAGLMHDLFARGLTADGKLRPPREQAPELYQETPIGWIPKEWNFELLEKLTDRGSGHTPNRNIPEYWNGGIKWISLSDSRRLDNLYISDTDFEISKLGIQNSSAVMQPSGVVVMSRDAGVGKSAITAEPMAVSQHFMCWKCGSLMDNHYLYYWLQFKKRMFENIAMGSTIVTIGLPYFKRLKISAPKEISEQKKIGIRLKAVDNFLFSTQGDLAKLKKQKSGLMHDLLTGEVRVTVDQAETAHV